MYYEIEIVDVVDACKNRENYESIDRGKMSKDKKKIEKYSFTWNLSKSQIFKEDFTSLKSPNFVDSQNQVAIWNLFLNRRMDSIENDECFSLFIHLVDDLKMEAKADFKLSFLNNNGRKIKDMASQDNIIQYQGLCGTFFDFFSKKFIINNIGNSNSSDNLRIVCEITMLYDLENTNSSFVTEPILSVSNLLFSSRYSDITIRVDGIDINAHKIVLTRRSSVFDMMFQNNLKENQSNILEIKDFHVEVVREMLKFMYTNTCPNLKSMPIDMLVIADKYDIGDLKKKAEQALCTTLAIENACEYLVISKEYSNEKLYELCLNFIVLNGAEVVKTKLWKSFVLTYPLLLESLFKRAVKIE